MPLLVMRGVNEAEQAELRPLLLAAARVEEAAAPVAA